MSASRGGKVRIGLAILVMAALAAASLIGTATAGPNDPITGKQLRKRSGAYTFRTPLYEPPNQVPDSNNPFEPTAQIGGRHVPKGKYVIIAKVWIGGTDSAACALEAGGDYDYVDFTQGLITLIVPHKFGAGGGDVILGCNDVGGSATWLKQTIAAMEFPKLDNDGGLT